MLFGFKIPFLLVTFPFLNCSIHVNDIMLYAIIVLFVLAAVVGLIILKNWITGSETSRTTVYVHGIFAALGLVLLIVHYFQNGAKALQTSIILFVVAALAGFYMFLRDLKGKMSPVWLAVVHGLVGATGLIFIVLTVI